MGKYEFRGTPGPWYWGHAEYGDGDWLVAKDNGMVIDYAGCGSHSCEISAANAQAISAVPELIQSCKLLIDSIEGGETTPEDAVSAIRNALAKATGERTGGGEDE